MMSVYNNTLIQLKMFSRVPMYKDLNNRYRNLKI